MENVEELISKLREARHVTPDQLQNLSIDKLREDRSGALDILAELNKENDQQYPGLTKATVFLENEIDTLGQEIRRRDGNRSKTHDVRRGDGSARPFQARNKTVSH